MSSNKGSRPRRWFMISVNDGTNVHKMYLKRVSKAKAIETVLKFYPDLTQLNIEIVSKNNPLLDKLNKGEF